MPDDRESPSRRSVRHEQTDAMHAACRVLVAVSAQSIAAVEDAADLIQVRALMVIASRRSASLSELAEGVDIHLTRASRLCDRLVDQGLIDRSDDPADRRQLVLTLTAQGRRVVHRVTERQRQAIGSVLARMNKVMGPQRVEELVSLLQDFAEAGGEPSDSDLWAMGWLSSTPAS